MLVNNMESVVKVFFRGSSTLRVKKSEGDLKHKSKIEQNLSVLEKKGLVKTRVRNDTKVKQFHAGQIFDYLKTNIKLSET
jgi:hypothetical protein